MFGRKYWWLVAVMMTVVTATSPPNVVFILVDDMGWNDVSFHGSDQILTPNIDALAYSGVILQNYYSEPICTPARTALLTGKYPMRLGMHGTPLYNSEDRGIPLTERLLPSYLKGLGYSTHLVGKWHVGLSKPEYLPTSRGFDSHYGIRGGFIDYYSYNLAETWPNGRRLFGFDLYENHVPQENETQYIIDALTNKAVGIISHHNTSVPLFLHVAHNAPHAGNAGGLLQPPLNSTLRNRHVADPDRRLYAEIVTEIDRSVGHIVAALAQRNILQDTIIIFASDNGAPTIGENNNWGVNLPFRGIKSTPWEGGVRVPAFIWHSSLKPRIWDGLMHITDWLPTLVTAAGGQVCKDIDGINQWNSIKKDAPSKRHEVLLNIEDSATISYAAYREGDYKLIVGNVTGLYNDYYGTQYLINKSQPPAYFPSLKSCEVLKILENIGHYFNNSYVQAIRAATGINSEDTKDSTACLPSPTRGCLYNVRRDPTESHDIWDNNKKTASTMTTRLRALWAMQMKRGPTKLDDAADPAYHDYNWTPWIPSHI